MSPPPAITQLDLQYTLNKDLRLRILLTDLQGKTLKTVVSIQNQPAVSYRETIEVNNHSAGIYLIFIEMEAQQPIVRRVMAR